MRAATIHRYGPPEVFTIDDVEIPSVGPRDVLIELHAASVNPVDWKIRQGLQQAFIRYRLPHVLGLDGSGVVVEVGRKVTRFAVGDEVFTSPTHRRSGTYAEYVAVDEAAVAHKPRRLDHAQAAAIPLAAQTAHECFEAAGLKAGDRVFIQAGAGGVGHLAIQMAKHLGAFVTASCSGRNVSFVRELGADEVVDYTTTRYDDVLRDYDMVLDALGGEHHQRSLSVLKEGGHLVTIVGGVPDAVKEHGPLLGAVVAMGKLAALKISAASRGLRLSYVVRSPNGDRLAAIAAMVEEGALTPVIDRSYPLEEIAEAHRYSESGRARGKITIAIR
jgi:NADPH:quinone reductase-like Zn-dependent oxidoreductase